MKYSTTTIAASEATASENLSRMYFAEIVANEKWRCYYSEEQGKDVVLDLVEKFMNRDARVPSIVTGENFALIPLKVIRFKAGNRTIEGWLYLNGAVVVSKAVEDLIFLFIDDELAVKEGYPDEFFVYRTDQGEPEGE